jgi:hypothetical protein
MANATKLLLGRGAKTQLYQESLEDPFCYFPEQVFVFDCCRQGVDDYPGRGQGPAWSGTDLPSSQPVSQSVLFAARHGEFAKTVPLGGKSSQCVLTYALLEGLDGKAAVRYGKGYAVTVRSLARYAYWRLESLKREGIAIEQAPDVIGSGVTDLVLVQDVPPPPANVTIHRSGGSTATIVRAYVDGKDQAEQAALNGATATMWLVPGPYTFETDSDKDEPTGRIDVPVDGQEVDVQFDAANNA